MTLQSPNGKEWKWLRVGLPSHLIVECVVIHLNGAVTVFLCHNHLMIHSQETALSAACEGLHMAVGEGSA